MEFLLVLAFLQLLSTPAFSVPEGSRAAQDYYEPFGPFGPCSRSCGTGVSVRTRRCITQRADGRNNCVGPAKEYRVCNTQECPLGSRDFREQQCSQFDGRDFNGKSHTWLPYYGAQNPCELNCIPRGESFFYRQRATVLDGTPCYQGDRDICVEGVCKRLGCDNKLDSPLQEDPCLQCGGNGDSCFLVRNSFSRQDIANGHHEIITIPQGATTIRIRELGASQNYLAIKNTHGEYYLNGHGVADYTHTIPLAGSTLYYQRHAEGDRLPESIRVRGPTNEQLVIELFSKENNAGVEYEYYLPVGTRRESYTWSYGPFSECSSECGTGFQSRRVVCVRNSEVVSEHLCANIARPPSNRTCHLRECVSQYAYEAGEFGTCSASCGEGVQTRPIYCVVQDATGRRVVEDSYCNGYTRRALTRPHDVQACHMPACHDRHITDSNLGLVYDPNLNNREQNCRDSNYGCCDDGHTAAQGYYKEGCPEETCARSRYGCCLDGVTAALGPHRDGCYDTTRVEPSVRCHSTTYGCCPDQVTRATGPNGEGCAIVHTVSTDCSLSYDTGACSDYSSRYYYDAASGRCNHFWYGGCHGNGNNFLSKEACESRCHVRRADTGPRPRPHITGPSTRVYRLRGVAPSHSSRRVYLYRTQG